MDAKINFPDLSMLLAKQCNMSVAKAELFSKAFFDIIIEGLEKDGIVKVNGLGTFKIIDVASRSSVNVNTGEKFEIKGHRKLTFIPAETLKEKINAPFAMFEPVEVTDDYVDDATECQNNEDIEEENLSKDSKLADNSAEENTPVDNKAVEVESQASEEPSANEGGALEVATVDTAEDNNGADLTEKETQQSVIEGLQEENSAPVQMNGGRKNRAVYVCFFLLLLVVAVGGYFIHKGWLAEHDEQSGGNVPMMSVKSEPASRQPADVVPVDTLPLPKKEEEPVEQPFIMVEELANRSLSIITVNDTLLYKAVGNLTIHRVGADETLTKIALKYYGDKKLWPYLVKHNDMGNHNQLEIGMELAIPRLVPRK